MSPSTACLGPSKRRHPHLTGRLSVLERGGHSQRPVDRIKNGTLGGEGVILAVRKFRGDWCRVTPRA